LLGNTVALGGNTGALAANNALTATGTGATGTLASAAVRRLPSAVSSRRTPLPHQDRRNVWEQQAAVLRTAHSKAARDVVLNSERYDSLIAKYNATSDPKYLAGAQQAYARERVATRQRNNLERNMQSLRDAQRRNPLNLTARQHRERRAGLRAVCDRLAQMR
jgi:hypothetical protein